jgi:hypothetical protein
MNIILSFFITDNKKFSGGTPSLIPPGDSAGPEPNMVQGRDAGEVL